MSKSSHSYVLALITAAVMSFSVSFHAAAQTGATTVASTVIVKHGIEEGDCTGHHRKDGVDCEDRLEHHK